MKQRETEHDDPQDVVPLHEILTGQESHQLLAEMVRNDHHKGHEYRADANTDIDQITALEALLCRLHIASGVKDDRRDELMEDAYGEGNGRVSDLIQGDVDPDLTLADDRLKNPTVRVEADECDTCPQ